MHQKHWRLTISHCLHLLMICSWCHAHSYAMTSDSHSHLHCQCYGQVLFEQPSYSCWVVCYVFLCLILPLNMLFTYVVCHTIAYCIECCHCSHLSLFCHLENIKVGCGEGWQFTWFWINRNSLPDTSLNEVAGHSLNFLYLLLKAGILFSSHLYSWQRSIIES